MDEEDRLMKAMAARADKAFEDRRKAALQGYKGGFKLADDPASPKSTEAIKKTLANPALEGKGYTASALSPKTQYSGGGSFGSGDDAVRSGSGESLSAYFDKSQQSEREFQQRREEEERKKQEYIASLSGGGLADYERQQAERDREFWRRQEEEERKKKEAVATESPSFQAYKKRQEEEEREFRRKREEEDARKKDQLDFMQKQDEQRRQELLQRQKEDEEARRRRLEVENAARNTISCDSCRKSITKQEAVQVKGRSYCYPCSVNASAEKCAGCGKPIIGGSTMKAGSKKYHPECLKCGKCGAALSGGFRMRGATMLCVNCSTQGL